jgi:TatD DNase family protein
MIDSHCHIDLYDSPIEVAETAEKASIRTVAVTYLPSHYELAQKHLSSFRFVRPALGLHPLAAKDHERELPLFLKLASKAEFIGEVGLDFSRAGKGTKALQEKSFFSVLNALRGKKCFATIHSRGAEEAVLDGLKSAQVGPVVFHWFSGSRSQLVKIIDSGHYVSINPAMIETEKWKELIKVVPQRMVLTESDGPFSQYRGRPSTPSDMGIVLQWLAEKWGMPVQNASDAVQTNFARIVPINT